MGPVHVCTLWDISLGSHFDRGLTQSLPYRYRPNYATLCAIIFLSEMAEFLL